MGLACACWLPAQDVFTKALTNNYNRYKEYLIDAAQVMPEADYQYRLTPPQRPYGEWFEHTALMNFSYCANIKGVPPPEATKSLHGITKKEELQKALKDSFDYCDAAFQGMDDAKAAKMVEIGERKVVPANVMVNLVTALNEHYGNLVGYLRTKGITPPSTARAQQKKK
jgi:hypothetical protein